MSTPATLRAWLAGNYDARLLTPEASPRRYFRSLHPDTRGWLRVVSPTAPPHVLTEFLLGLGVRVPQLGPHVDDVYLVEDLGDLHLTHRAEVDDYRAVLAAHRRYFIAELPSEHPNRQLALDATLFERELLQFADAYLQPYLGRKLSVSDCNAIRGFCSSLAKRAALGPQALQHRDLHSRNILIVGEGIALIDHQDMRRGPLFYDLASLVSDAYVDLSDDVLELLESEFGWLADAASLDRDEARDQFLLTAMQRVLKALGTFGHLLTSGRDDYRPAVKRASRAGNRLWNEGQERGLWERVNCPESLAEVFRA